MKFVPVIVKMDITLYMRNNPKNLLVVQAGYIFCVAQDESPQAVRGGSTDLPDMLPAEYRASTWDNRVTPVAVWVSKSILEEALEYSSQALAVI